MDLSSGSAPSRHDRRERFLGILLLGAIRVCCRLFASPALEPVRPIATAIPGARRVIAVGRPEMAGHEDRGPPTSFS